MKLADFVVREAILTDLQATTKEDAIRELVRSLYDAGALAEADLESITRALLEREEIGSTGTGQGMACPEARHPAVERVIGTVALSRRGVEFAALDGEPVDLLFLLLGPPNKLGDFIEARGISSWHVLADEHLRTRLRQAQTREQVGDLLEEVDRRLAVFPSQGEVRQLPLRALVAYATRSARRVQPFFTLPDDCGPRRSAERIPTRVNLHRHRPPLVDALG